MESVLYESSFAWLDNLVEEYPGIYSLKEVKAIKQENAKLKEAFVKSQK